MEPFTLWRRNPCGRRRWERNPYSMDHPVIAMEEVIPPTPGIFVRANIDDAELEVLQMELLLLQVEVLHRMQLRQARQWLAAMQRRQALRAEAARPDKTDEKEGGTGGPAGVA